MAVKRVKMRSSRQDDGPCPLAVVSGETYLSMPLHLAKPVGSKGADPSAGAVGPANDEIREEQRAGTLPHVGPFDCRDGLPTIVVAKRGQTFDKLVEHFVHLLRSHDPVALAASDVEAHVAVLLARQCDGPSARPVHSLQKKTRGELMHGGGRQRVCYGRAEPRGYSRTQSKDRRACRRSVSPAAKNQLEQLRKYIGSTGERPHPDRRKYYHVSVVAERSQNLPYRSVGSLVNVLDSSLESSLLAWREPIALGDLRSIP